MCGRCCQVFAIRNTVPSAYWEAIRDYVECYGDVENPELSEDGTVTYDHFIRAACRHQLSDGRCGIHDRRPAACRNYPTESSNALYRYLKSQGVTCGYQFVPRDRVEPPSDV